MSDEAKPISEIFEYPLMVKEAHLDLFGHMNNATYLQLFEEARWEIITPRGFGIKKVMEMQIGPTILDIHLQFRKELRLREKFTIRSWVTNVQGKTSSMRQVMINEKGEEACIADFVFGLFDIKARKLILPTPEWRHALGLPPA